MQIIFLKRVMIMMIFKKRSLYLESENKNLKKIENIFLS